MANNALRRIKPVLKMSTPVELNNPTGFRVTFLGTSSSRPTKSRNVTSALFRTTKETFMIDCGEGTQQQLLSCPQVRTPKKILITHTHGDHIYGLPGRT